MESKLVAFGSKQENVAARKPFRHVPIGLRLLIKTFKNTDPSQKPKRQFRVSVIFYKVKRLLGNQIFLSTIVLSLQNIRSSPDFARKSMFI